MSKKPKSTRPAKKEPKFQPGSNKEREARSRIVELEAENRRLRVLNNQPEPADLTLRSRRLLRSAVKTIEHLTDTVVSLEEASDPSHSVVISANPRQPSRPNSEKDEGAKTRWERSLLDRIHKQVTQLCDEYDLRVEGKWHPPAQSPSSKVWCRNSTCEARNKRVPKFVGPRGDSRIEMVWCQVCNGKLSEAT